MASGGDVDGDGLDDLLVGADAWDEREPGVGQAFLILGRDDLHDGSLADADFVITGALGDLAGHAVALAGDVNGDGFADLLVGAYGDPAGGLDREDVPAGAAYLVLGGDLPGEIALSEADARFTGAPGERAGWDVAHAGDVDGDGLDDLLVGAAGSVESGRAGAAYLLLGSATLGDRGLAEADACFQGPSWSGAAVARPWSPIEAGSSFSGARPSSGAPTSRTGTTASLGRPGMPLGAPSRRRATWTAMAWETSWWWGYGIAWLVLGPARHGKVALSDLGPTCSSAPPPTTGRSPSVPGPPGLCWAWCSTEGRRARPLHFLIALLQRARGAPQLFFVADTGGVLWNQ